MVGLGSLKGRSSSLLEEDCWLGDLIWRIHVDPSNDDYCHDCLLGCALFRGNWKAFGKIATVTVMTTGFVFAGLNTAVNHQRVVPILKQEGLAKGPLLFINLGLTDMGHNQEDMKEGLLAYIDEDKRSDYNNGLFKKKM